MAGVMSKKLKYTLIKENDTLDISLALSQAAALLDEIAKKAIKEKDSSLMLDIADRWISIGKMFTIESTDEHLDTDAEFQQYGFVYEKKEVMEEDE